eukprot:jgi/Mesen1/1443/ME000132S00386
MARLRQDWRDRQVPQEVHWHFDPPLLELLLVPLQDLGPSIDPLLQARGLLGLNQAPLGSNPSLMHHQEGPPLAQHRGVQWQELQGLGAHPLVWEEVNLSLEVPQAPLPLELWAHPLPEASPHRLHLDLQCRQVAVRPGAGPPAAGSFNQQQQQQQAQQLSSPPPPMPGVVPGGQYGYAHGAAQPLIEEFQSLTLNQVPGQIDAGIDVNSLPRLTTTPDKPVVIAPTNAHPRYVRLTCNAMPNSQSLRSRWHLPLGAVLQPLAEPPPGEEVPVVNFGTSGIVRCRRCRTYVNPYVVFTDGGRRWRCNVCGLLNEGRPASAMCLPGIAREGDAHAGSTNGRVAVPGDYFCPLDHDGRRRDLEERPELSQGSVEFVAPAEYMVRAPMPPIYFFLIDVSLSGASSGKLRAKLGGKLLVFQSTLPSLGPGRLKLRGNDPRIYNTDKEHTVRGTEEPFYKTMAADFSRAQISVNVYAFSSTYTDLASLGTGAGAGAGAEGNVGKQAGKRNGGMIDSTLSRYTSGQVYYYPGFQLARQGDKFSRELARDLTRETAWEAVMRIRCGKGLKISTFHGHFFVRSIDLLALPAVDCDKAFAVQISHEETLLTNQTVYLQCALLYTSSSGERRIRVHTSAIPVVADLGEMYRAADCGAVGTVLAKLALEKAMTARLEDARQLVMQKCIAGLREYRSLFAAQHRTAGRLIFPETLRMLPLLALAACKAPALRGGFSDLPPDARSAASYEMTTMPVARTLKLLYPSLFRIDTMPPECGKPGGTGAIVMPPALPLVIGSIDVHGAYLLDDGLQLVMWFGTGAPREYVAQLLGAAAADTPELSSPTEKGKQLAAIVEQLRKESPVYQEVHLVRQGEPREALLLSSMVEDRGAGGAFSYADFVLHVHRQVQQK